MDALSLLAEARAAGLDVRVDGDRLVVRGPKTAEPLVRRLGEAKADVIALLDPAARVAAFQEQLDAWRADCRPGVPFFALPGVESPTGCLSCALPLPAGRAYRCAPCAEAVRIVLEHDGRGEEPAR